MISRAGRGGGGYSDEWNGADNCHAFLRRRGRGILRLARPIGKTFVFGSGVFSNDLPPL